MRNEALALLLVVALRAPRALSVLAQGGSGFELDVDAAAFDAEGVGQLGPPPAPPAPAASTLQPFKTLD
eukprot:15206944-Alexandrium_andersonii.AAC.1